ncbi:MAG: ABC transporter permease [Burkholderiaceae bacterium]
MNVNHGYQALIAVSGRELGKFVQQRGRLFSALVRPALWLLVFAAGFQNVFGVAVIEPYESYVEYQVYIVPGLIGMVLLFNSMQSSLAMVYDREMGLMRLLLTAPLPRWYLLFAKLTAGAVLSVLQVYAFVALCAVFRIDLPWTGMLVALPAVVLVAFMLGSLGLLLSVSVRQLENFAGTMNFVIFPMFFISSALYPIWRFEEAGAMVLVRLSQFNPFTHGVELIRYALYGKFNGVALAVVVGSMLVFFALAVWGYDPQKGLAARRGAAA